MHSQVSRAAGEAQSQTPPVVSDLDKDSVLYKAAVKIQSRYRGYIIRKVVLCCRHDSGLEICRLHLSEARLFKRLSTSGANSRCNMRSPLVETLPETICCVHKRFIPADEFYVVHSIICLASGSEHLKLRDFAGKRVTDEFKGFVMAGV